MTIDRANLDQLKIERPSDDRGRSRTWIYAAITAAAAIIAIVAIAMRQSAPAVRVAMARAVSAPSGGSAILNASGYVTARRQATVSAKVTGKVAQVLIEEGMHVKAGQVLATLDDARASSSLQLAKAQAAAAASALEETRVRITEAQTNFNRSRSLSSQQIASRADLDRDTASLNALHARLAAQADSLNVAQRQVQLIEQDMADTVVRAPFDGVVITKDAQPGEMVSPISAGGGFTRTGICTIVDMDSLEIDVDVSEAYINRVRPAQPVEAVLDAYPDWRIPAHVITAIPAADRQKATVKVRIAFDAKDARLLPDMGVKVAFIDDMPKSQAGGGIVEIPGAAVRHQGDQDFVFVVAGDRLERRAVKVVGSEGGRVRVAAGLSAGERVVVEGPPDLKDQQQVKAKEEKSS
jgi:RND family efflux transporter MFP subunit